MSDRVVVLTTGGTIGHRSQADGVAAMTFDPGRLMAEIGARDVEASFVPVMRKGSMDIGPDEWRVIADAILAAVATRPRGIVVLHGTDTMHYTAAALTFMLRGLPVPVAMTGSMIPGGDPGSDAALNLRDAIEVAARGDFAEVCIVFSADSPRSHARIIRGCRARKVRSFAIDAFASINAPPIGAVRDGRIARTALAVAPRSDATPRLAAGLDGRVVLIKLTPNLTPPMLARMLEDTSGAVLEGTGIGHIRTDLQPVVRDYGKPVVIGTQAAEGGERLGAYDVDRAILAIPNLIPGSDMTSETALVKLMWALPQGGDVAAILRRNVAGEISAV